MPNLDELLGLINPATVPAPPQAEPEDDITSLLRGIQELKTKNAELDSREQSILNVMGAGPKKIQERMMAEDKPQGFWKTLGKYGSEALLGAVSGRGYVPYSERMYGKAVNEYEAQSRANEKQLSSLTQQKNKVTDSETKLRAAAARMGVDYDKLALQKDALNLKRTAFDAGADQRAANVGKTKAQTGVLESQAEKIGAETEGVYIKNNNLASTLGVGGLPGAVLAMTNKMNKDKVDPFLDIYNRMDANKQKNKALAPQKSAASSPYSATRIFPGTYVDEATGAMKQGYEVVRAPKAGGPVQVDAPAGIRLRPEQVKSAKNFEDSRAQARIARTTLLDAYLSGDDAFTGPVGSSRLAGLARTLELDGNKGFREAVYDITNTNSKFMHGLSIVGGRVPQFLVQTLDKSFVKTSGLKSAAHAALANELMISVGEDVTKGRLDPKMITQAGAKELAAEVNKFMKAVELSKQQGTPLTVEPPDPREIFMKHGLQEATKKDTPLARSMSGGSSASAGGSDLEKAQAALMRKLQGTK